MERPAQSIPPRRYQRPVTYRHGQKERKTMQSKSGNSETTISDAERAKQFSIRKSELIWTVTMFGQSAQFKHQKGALYAAYLLVNPPDEPIHGAALELKA